MEDKEGVGLRRVSRRTIVKGAAWSMPVVAAAVAVPAHAASTGIVVTGSSPVPTGVCSPTGNFTITVNNSGAPVSGAVVTVTLPAGFAWPDHTTAPKQFITGSNGTVTITGVTGPSAPGTYNVMATVGSGSTAATGIIPIMVQGTWAVVGAGPAGAPAHVIYTNPTDVNNLGPATCLAYCIEHNMAGPNGQAVFAGPASSFLGSNNFNNGVSTTNYVLPGGATSATLTAALVQAKVEWIMQHSYPMVSLSALEAATGQSGLLEDDVIEATQYAIWAYTDLAYIDSNWPFADGDPTNQTPRFLQEKAVYTYLVNGAWNDAAAAPSSCLKVVSSSTSQCGTPTAGAHKQSLAMVCDCA
ncbi:MAG: Cys-Gln thioester bond-forming surface protein [Microbacterium sp.]|jgi:TQXA domain-containing protein|uniref:Cys-Gln thioester bond-forming surface protein n=1 Tax=Microbacterium sp. TaxID=51671 RepID=UPI00281EDDB0|nr:Cys-Gln thioester bond-forming surface protein [Microbacterium sp.]MDR2321443.1 Cys-Gln thioester bond-forming surface protein [Microbacterium sp.]